MIAIFIRIVLFAAPLVGLFLYLRWRKKQLQEGAELDKELLHLRMGLAGVLVVVFLAFMGLRFFDTEKGAPGDTYIPPHMKDGKLVPGQFKDDTDSDKDGSQSLK